MVRIPNQNPNVGGAGNTGSSGMSASGLEAMRSINDALKEMRAALKGIMNDISDALDGKNIFGI